MAMFKAFKPSGMEKIARAMGYQGNMQGFQNYLAQDPMRQQQMQNYQQKAMQMARGGMVKMQTGGLTPQANFGMQPMSAQQQQEARDFVAAGGVPQAAPDYGQMLGTITSNGQMSGNITGNLADAYDPRGIQPPTSTTDPRLGGTPVDNRTRMPDGRMPPLPMYSQLGAPKSGSPQKAFADEINADPVGFGTPQPPPLSKQPYQQNYQSAPMYDQFKQSDYYKNMPKIGAMVTGSATIDGQTYNFPMAMESKAYNDYMRSLGGYQVGRPENPSMDVPQPVTQSAANTGTVAPGTPNVTNGRYIDPREVPDAMRIQEASNVPSGQPLIGRQQPLGLTGTVAPAPQENYLKGSKEQYDAFRKQYMQGGPRIETADVRMHPMQGFEFQGSSTEFGAFQDYLRGQQQAMDPRTAQQTTPPAATPPAAQTEAPKTIQEATMQRMYTPGLPEGGVTQAALTPSEAGQYVDPRTGTLTGAVAVPTAMAGTATAAATQEKQSAQLEAAQAAPAVDAALQATQVAQGTVDPRAQVTAAQQTASSVGNLTAAQGNATLIDNPVQRQIQDGELISGVADAQTAAQFTEQIQAAEATPSKQATVQGQLEQLTANFDASNPPAWAAGSLRAATQAMAARGLGASSMAGQAILQATLEAALPIAQADANVTAQFEAQNLSNRQQRAMLAAQQRAQFMGQEFDQAFQARVQNAARIGDIANMNFTAEQQVQLENSRAANTMNLNNLSNKQAMVIAEASALANMDLSNLNNRQQSAVMNAQSFMNMDMANLSNQQQSNMFQAQQRIQSLFTDQAAENAARQFNASSQNQVDQFFASLGNQVQQFNATQINGQEQFNAGQRNTVERFNAELNNQRDQFNAQNQLVIAQNNAQWRRELATADTAAVNRANELNAAAVLDVSKTAYDNMWQYYADTMEWAWTSAENNSERLVQMAVAELDAKVRTDLGKLEVDAAESGAIGGFISDVFTSPMGGTFLGNIFCWVAREVYGPENTDWIKFRNWMFHKAPKWLFNLYARHGEKFAKFISDKPKVKWAVKKFMDRAINK